MKIAFLLLTLVKFSYAEVVTLKRELCVPSSSQDIHDSITNYNAYTRLPGAVYTTKMATLGELKLLEMIKSQAKYRFREERQTEALIWTVLRPLNLREGRLYPRFLLNCKSEFTTENQFTQSCSMLTQKEHYGLDGFESTLFIEEGHSLCAENESLLNFQATLVSNKEDVAEIKKEALKSFGFFGSLIGAFFKDEAFLRSYFENFYDGWISTLK